MQERREKSCLYNERRKEAHRCGVGRCLSIELLRDMLRGLSLFPLPCQRVLSIARIGSQLNVMSTTKTVSWWRQHCETGIAVSPRRQLGEVKREVFRTLLLGTQP
eukprot:1671761-Amphidinium_carterae.1